MKKRLFQNLCKLMFLVLTLPFVSCESQEDKLAGNWDTMFGISRSSYTEYRVYRPDGPGSTMIERFTFTKGTDGKKGTFVDSVFPLIPGDNLVVGSKVTGEWEIKDKKLYLYYDDLTLTGTTDKLSEESQMNLEIEMTDKFFSDYMNAGEEGLPYRIVKEKGKTRLEIDFPGGKVQLTRDEEKSKKK